MKFLSLIFISILVSLSSCIKDAETDLFVEGAVPIYAILDIEVIKSSPPQEMTNTSNFILYNSYILIIEKFKGIHVIDNTNPSSPLNISFIEIPGVTQLTASNGILYVNFGRDLVSVDISDLLNVQVLTSIFGFYSEESLLLYPENFSGYFECVDLSKGVVVEWNLMMLTNPNCRVF